MVSKSKKFELCSEYIANKEAKLITSTSPYIQEFLVISTIK